MIWFIFFKPIEFIGKIFRLAFTHLLNLLKTPKHKKRKYKQKINFFDSLYILILKLKLRFWDIPKPSIKIVFLLSFLFFLYTTSTLLNLVFDKLPSPEDLINRKIPISTKIYDRNGTLLYQIYKDENRTPVGLEQIPQVVIYSTLAIEDANFYHHFGFSIKGIVRAFITNIETGKETGGSTITQQLVKNALLNNNKTYLRKLRELILALKVESAYSKDQILTMYLNEVSYGNSAYGIEEAAQVYFGIHANQLDLAQAAFLAGLPKGPTRFSPFGANPELAKSRQEEVLDLMAANNFISKQTANETKQEKLTFAPQETYIQAPHFVMYVKSLLVDQFGEDQVENGGLEVYTTLDLGIQKMAEQAVADQIAKLGPLHVTNGDALVINPQTGEILAMVGSKNYFDLSQDGNVNVTLRPRSPGSSIKIVTYSHALAHGMTPATVIPDTPLRVFIQGQPDYVPKDYDNTFKGNLTLRSAFAQSRNIPAVRVITTFGVEQIRSWGEQLGITTWGDKNRFGPSLTLGGGEVKLIDLARVYATFANMGRQPELLAISKITDSDNNTVLQHSCLFSINITCPTSQVVDPRIAFLIINILSDNNARSAAFGTHSALVIPNHPEVAVKTGTSNDLRDNLTLGFNQDYLVAVWVGNNDNSPMSRVASGITGASPIWNEIMGKLIANQPSKNWPIPDGLKQAKVCGKDEWFLNESEVPAYCPLGSPKPSASPTPTP